MRLAETSLLFTIASAFLLASAGVAGDVLVASEREQMAALKMPCTEDMPPHEMAVVLDVLSVLAPGGSFALAERTTADGSGFIFPPAPFPRAGFVVSGDVWTDYVTKNYEPRCVRSAGHIPVLAPNDFRRSHERAFWPWFRRRMGDKVVLVRVSRAGFSADQKDAVLAVGVACGVLCGGGDLVHARWDGSHWRVIKGLRTWMS